MLRRAVLLGSTLLVAACAQAPRAAEPAPTTTPPPDPVVVCTNQLTYWAGEDLSGDADGNYDYQHRGLTSEQNDVLTQLVAQASGRGVERGATRRAGQSRMHDTGGRAAERLLTLACPGGRPCHSVREVATIHVVATNRSGR